MKESVAYLTNEATAEQIAEHLACCDAYFVPLLSARVEIVDYAQKIASKAIRFEAWSDNKLVGLAAAYGNDRERRIAYITSVSTLPEWSRRGIATQLVLRAVDCARLRRMRRISLDVASDQRSAMHLYEKCGFSAGETNGPFVSMTLNLEIGDTNETHARL
jgi:ribosomal protein S18 acetylase RimI-like enzyme